VLFTLNGFTLNDPLSGRFESRVGVEAVQSVDVANGRLPAEYGRGSAGMVAVTTTPGDDKLRYSATNFFPGMESRKGLYLGNWSPRINVSGPIRKGRAWFSDSIAAQYDQQVLEELPAGADRLSAWRLSNLLHTQVNLTPSQILYTGVLLNGWSAPRFGLNALNPPETTLDRRTRQWFFNLKDQICFGTAPCSNLDMPPTARSRGRCRRDASFCVSRRRATPATRLQTRSGRPAVTSGSRT